MTAVFSHKQLWFLWCSILMKINTLVQIKNEEPEVDAAYAH